MFEIFGSTIPVRSMDSVLRTFYILQQKIKNFWLNIENWRLKSKFCLTRNFIGYNTPCSLRVTVGVLYKVEDCEVELYNIFSIRVGEL